MQAMYEDLLKVGEGAPSLREKCLLMKMLRETSGKSHQVDQFLLADNEKLRNTLKDQRETIREMKQLLDRATEPPWHTATYLGPKEDANPPRAIVYYSNATRIVTLADSVNPEELRAGDNVFLNDALNMILGYSSNAVFPVGETAVFDRYEPSGRAVVRIRGDEQMVVRCAESLRDTKLECGDVLRIDRSTWFAYEKVEKSNGEQYRVNEVPDAQLEDVGGQRASLNLIVDSLTAILAAPKKAKQYGVDGRPTILMIGPPGCGKTLMARAACAELSRQSGKPVPLAAPKPAEWENPYVGVTQENIRDTFRSVQEGVLFLDEINSVGRIRGSSNAHHSDKFLDALLAELDGFCKRPNVAVIAATNRKDLCDPALLDRFETEISVERPNMQGAREIFGIHLGPTIPYCPNGDTAMATRGEIIDRAVSGLYSPNSNNEVCEIRFRDGKKRTITARELVSGRLIEQICRKARKSAFLRDIRLGDTGLRVEDMEEAVSDTIARMSTMIDRLNAHAHLSDLPQDVDVVAVEPIRHTNRQRYLSPS